MKFECTVGKYFGIFQKVLDFSNVMKEFAGQRMERRTK